MCGLEFFGGGGDIVPERVIQNFFLYYSYKSKSLGTWKHQNYIKILKHTFLITRWLLFIRGNSLSFLTCLNQHTLY